MAVGGNWPPKTLKPFADKTLVVGGNWPPKTLKPFADKGLNSATKTVKVIAQNSHHKGRYDYSTL